MATTKHPPVHIVWFKRDLRVLDHAPLTAAVASEQPVLPLYIVEPSQLNSPQYDPAHWTFTAACLHELRDRLAEMGQPLVVRIGEAVSVFGAIRRQMPIEHIWAHQETTNLLGYERDRAVEAWTQSQGIPFTQLPANGIVRGLKNRDGWEETRRTRMRAAILPAPAALA